MNINCAVDKSKYKKDRVILHSDCNGFYASVECLHHPEIRNKPVAVSGDAENRHGIILAKNEIAKKYNVKTGEAIWQAKQKCPDLITVPPHFDLYKRFSKMNMLQKCISGSAIITALEYCCGCVVNLKFRLNVWDYSNCRLNLKGQICPFYSTLWAFLCIPVSALCTSLCKKIQ